MIEAQIYKVEGEGKRKEIIEELKIVQDILLKQEAYALGALRQAYIIETGLIVLYFNTGNSKWEAMEFVVLSELVFLSFLYVQVIYRQAFHDGLDRSHFLQDLLGGRPTRFGYEPFAIHKCFHRASFKLKSSVFWHDLRDARFFVPNVVLFLSPLGIAFLSKMHDSNP